MFTELYEPTVERRNRPSFLRLDKESGKWRELYEAFISDVCRDADYITITEMYYIRAPKLEQKVCVPIYVGILHGLNWIN